MCFRSHFKTNDDDGNIKHIFRVNVNDIIMEENKYSEKFECRPKLS